MNTDFVDVLVIGGGPAGSTLAAILLRHRPGTRVRILERERFPRFHVGETLVSDINLILHEMGAYDAVNDAGFVRKFGATFRWGASPEPWNLLFATMDELRPDSSPVQTAYTWHVDRARYDTLLLDVAVRAGAELEVDAVVSLLEEDGRVVGARTASGRLHRARFVVDATGQAGLAESRAERVYDPYLRNVAWWGYFRGARFEEPLNGAPDRSRAFIVAHRAGWSWYFPIAEDLVSVGVITQVEAGRGAVVEGERGAGGDFGAGGGGGSRGDVDGASRRVARFRQIVSDCPELARLVSSAELVAYTDGAPLVHAIRDFSYVAASMWRPGLVRVGDAAGFVDPILSVGCFLGQSGARHLAYSLRTLLDGGSSPLDETTVLDAYADHTRDTLHAFRELTWFFYKFNARTDEWWARARALVRGAGLPESATDRHAFSAFASGFAARGAVHREPNGVFGEPFFADAFRHLVDPSGAPPPRPPRVHRTDRPRLVGPVTRRPSAVPLDGQGRVIPAVRVELAHAEPDAGARRLYVPSTMAPLLDWLDGTHDLAALVRRLEATQHLPESERPRLVRYVREAVAGLLERGVVAVG
jgi:halogenation protein CepH